MLFPVSNQTYAETIHVCNQTPDGSGAGIFGRGLHHQLRQVADQRFALINGTDIRDFYQGSFANTINGTTTKEVFRIDNVQTQNLVTMKITPPSLARSCSSE
ncbi:MAG TPA: hypothetical protein VKE70_34470 [Candidatus Solibacter sp.]|nr:hypothetical protein [Candidatus Solibacter sp.]